MDNKDPAQAKKVSDISKGWGNKTASTTPAPTPPVHKKPILKAPTSGGLLEKANKKDSINKQNEVKTNNANRLNSIKTLPKPSVKVGPKPNVQVKTIDKGPHQRHKHQTIGLTGVSPSTTEDNLKSRNSLIIDKIKEISIKNSLKAASNNDEAPQIPPTTPLKPLKSTLHGSLQRHVMLDEKKKKIDKTSKETSVVENSIQTCGDEIGSKNFAINTNSNAKTSKPHESSALENDPKIFIQSKTNKKFKLLELPKVNSKPPRKPVMHPSVNLKDYNEEGSGAKVETSSNRASLIKEEEEEEEENRMKETLNAICSEEEEELYDDIDDFAEESEGELYEDF